MFNHLTSLEDFDKVRTSRIIEIRRHIEPDDFYGPDEANDEFMTKERREAFYSGDWNYTYVVLEADIWIYDEVKQFGISKTFTSGGLSGVESDAGEDYLNDIFDDEFPSLRELLRHYGFTDTEINRAYQK